MEAELLGHGNGSAPNVKAADESSGGKTGTGVAGEDGGGDSGRGEGILLSSKVAIACICELSAASSSSLGEADE